MIIALLLLGVLLSHPASATLGIDVANPVTKTQFQCMVQNNNITFTIVRAFRSTGVIDDKAVATMNAAKAAGIAHVGAYLVPCFICGKPTDQVSITIGTLRNASAPFSMLSVDIGLH